MKHPFSSGFSLIEAMIAVSILTFAVAGPLFSASRAALAVANARNELTASYLAQEAVEYVRMMRDDEYLAAYRAGGSTISTVAWTNFIQGGDAASINACRGSACTLDPSRIMGSGSGFSLVACSGSSCAPLYLANGIYTEQGTLAGALLTPFTRTVRATDVSATDERITSTVTWTFHGNPYSVTITDHLTAWQ